MVRQGELFMSSDGKVAQIHRGLRIVDNFDISTRDDSFSGNNRSGIGKAFFKRQGLAGRQGAGKDIFAIDSLNITNSHSATKTNRVLVGAVLGHINQLADNDVVSLNVAGDSNLGTGNIQNASRAVIVSCKSNRLILAISGCNCHNARVLESNILADGHIASICVKRQLVSIDDGSSLNIDIAISRSKVQFASVVNSDIGQSQRTSSSGNGSCQILDILDRDLLGDNGAEFRLTRVVAKSNSLRAQCSGTGFDIGCFSIVLFRILGNDAEIDFAFGNTDILKCQRGILLSPLIGVYRNIAFNLGFSSTEVRLVLIINIGTK